MFKEDDDVEEGSMGATRYNVMPSLVALQQMRNRLHLAFLGKKLMKWTALATGKELRRLSIEITGMIGSYQDDVATAFMLLARSRYFFPKMNVIVLENVPHTASLRVSVRHRGVAGVKVVNLDILESAIDPYPYLGIEKGGMTIWDAKEAWYNVLKVMIMLLEAKTTFNLVEIAHKNATKTAEEITNTIGPRIICSYLLNEFELVKEREKERKATENNTIVKKQDAFSAEMELGVFNDDMDQIHTLIRPIPSFLDNLSSRGNMTIPKTTNSDQNSVHPILQLPQKRVFRRADKIKKSVEFSPIVESRHDSRIVLAKRPPAKDIKVDNEIRSLKETILFVNKKIDHVLEKIVSAPLPTPSEKVKKFPSTGNTVVKGQEPVQMAKDPPKGQKTPPTTPHSPQTTNSTSKQDAQPSNKENSLHQGTNIQTQSIQTNRRSAVKSQQTPRKLSTGQQTNKTQTTRHKEKSTQHKPHHTIEKSTQASNSKAGIMVKKLVGLLSRSSTKKSELVVIKPSEDVVSVDDFIPAKHKAKICKSIKKVDELVDNEKDVVVSNVLEQQGEDFETGEWFETPNGENKADATKDEEVHTPHTSKENLPVKSHPSKTNLEKKVRSLCVLPTKQNCETNLEVFVDKESSRDLSEDFEAALENFKTKHGESLDKDFIKNNKIAEIIDEKFKSKSDVDNKTKLASIKNKLQEISIDTDIMNDESDILNIFQSSSDSVRVSSITKEKIKEDKPKTKVKKKVQHKGKKDTETEMALRILNSDEIERKHIETENTKNRTKDNH